MAWADLPGISIRYELSGAGASTLVLIHELGGGLDSFDACLPALEQDNRVLRYDQRGAGLSEKPRAPFTIQDHAADLIELVRVAGIEPPYRVLGVAAGAAIAVSFALACPAMVEALVLCSPALETPAERRSYLAERSSAAEKDGMRAIAESTLARSYPLFLRQDTETYAMYRARFLANDPVAYAHANHALINGGLVDHLNSVTAPCLVLAGVHDLCVHLRTCSAYPNDLLLAHLH